MSIQAPASASSKKQPYDDDPSVPIVAREVRQSSSVVDYSNLSDLQNALESVVIERHEDGYNVGGKAAGSAATDWKLPVADPEAEEERVDVELQRLWTLKSYLLLDTECEEVFDSLTEEARRHFGVPTCAISLVDLGRQYMYSESNVNAADKATSGGPPSCKETPRSVAFCAHTILSKRGVCVVPDTKQDDRFKSNKLVTGPPYLRFYAGAPLLSPEGYKLGTFCVEGPEPRPGGLTADEEAKLHEYAARAMDYMVLRRKAINQHLMVPIKDNLRRYAGVLTNLGAELFQRGECLAAMKLFQESVQTLMFIQREDDGNASIAISSLPRALPTSDRQEEMAQILFLLTSETNTEGGCTALVRRIKFLVEEGANPTRNPPPFASFKDALKETSNDPLPDCDGKAIPGQLSSHNAIPGLFGMASCFHSTMGNRQYPPLVFSEPFRVSLADDQKGGKTDNGNFVVALDHCAKATLFNQGLVHWAGASLDNAMHFFDLAASLSDNPLDFDPVVIACLNNTSQINLIYGKSTEALELLADALARGDAALAAIYSDAGDGGGQNPDPAPEQGDIRSRRLRRKLARTVMNMGHVYFNVCKYDVSMASCQDAIRLLHTTGFENEEEAAAWHNVGVLYHHKGNKLKALEYLDKFILRAKILVGNSYQVAGALFRKGQVLFEMGNLYECMKPLNESLGIRRDSFGANHADVAESLCMIGKVLQAREEYDFSLKALEEGLSILRTQPAGGSLTLDAAQSMLDVGKAHHAQGNRREALRVYNEVATLAAKFFGHRHPYVARVRVIIGKIHLEAGEISESLRLFEEATKMYIEQGLPVDMGIVDDPLLGCLIGMHHNEIAPSA